MLSWDHAPVFFHNENSFGEKQLLYFWPHLQLHFRTGDRQSPDSKQVKKKKNKTHKTKKPQTREN